MNQRDYVGNYFNHKSYGIVQFADYHFHEIYENMDKLENFEPIHLTEDWLGKFGFKAMGKDGLYMKCPENSINGQYVKKYPDGLYYETGKGSCLHVEHVHQLQNIYYCHTLGKELEIQPKHDDKVYEKIIDSLCDAIDSEAKRLCVLPHHINKACEDIDYP